MAHARRESVGASRRPARSARRENAAAFWHNRRVPVVCSRLRPRTVVAGLVALVAAAASTPGCAHPHRSQKNLAAAGVLLAGGGTGLWVLGERHDASLVVPGMVTTLVGVGLVVAAGGWLAAAVACEADFQCAQGQECREIPAPPGGIPYKQCMPRPLPE